MTSNDNNQFVTIEIYNSGINKLEKQVIALSERQDNSFKELKNEIINVRELSVINSAKIDAYRDFTSIWFTVIAVIIAIVGVMATLAPMFRDARHEHRDNNLSRDEVQNMINSSISQMVNDAVSEALGKVGK